MYGERKMQQIISLPSNSNSKQFLHEFCSSLMKKMDTIKDNNHLCIDCGWDKKESDQFYFQICLEYDEYSSDLVVNLFGSNSDPFFSDKKLCQSCENQYYLLEVEDLLHQSIVFAQETSCFETIVSYLVLPHPKKKTKIYQYSG